MWIIISKNYGIVHADIHDIQIFQVRYLFCNVFFVNLTIYFKKMRYKSHNVSEKFEYI